MFLQIGRHAVKTLFERLIFDSRHPISNNWKKEVLARLVESWNTLSLSGVLDSMIHEMRIFGLLLNENILI